MTICMRKNKKNKKKNFANNLLPLELDKENIKSLDVVFTT